MPKVTGLSDGRKRKAPLPTIVFYKTNPTSRLFSILASEPVIRPNGELPEDQHIFANAEVCGLENQTILTHRLRTFTLF